MRGHCREGPRQFEAGRVKSKLVTIMHGTVCHYMRYLPSADLGMPFATGATTAMAALDGCDVFLAATDQRKPGQRCIGPRQRQA